MTVYDDATTRGMSIHLKGRSSSNDAYHEPAPAALHTHPAHRDPEYDDRIRGIAETSLWVVCAISNPVRYKSRYALYRKFRYHITQELGLNLLTVECAHGDRDTQLTTDGILDVVVETPNASTRTARTIDVRVRNSTFVWLKENLWNIGARHLPHDCEYVLFADADIRFENRHIATETIHALQEYAVVQPFETAADLGSKGEIIDVHRSFGYCHAHGWEWRPRTDGVGGYSSKPPPGVHAFGNSWHPGFAMAMRRRLLDTLPLLEVCALGAGDHHMCAAFIGKADLTFPKTIHQNYKKIVMAWQAKAVEFVRKNFGYVAGTISHGWHGTKANRKYVDRWTILIRHAFDPETDVYHNSRGVVELVDTKPGLRDDVRTYFRQRDEDA